MIEVSVESARMALPSVSVPNASPAAARSAGASAVSRQSIWTLSPVVAVTSKSVMVSDPLLLFPSTAITKVSAPVLPFSVSHLSPPASLLSPSPPLIVSDSSLPFRLSAPDVPVILRKELATVMPETSCDVALFQMVAVLPPDTSIIERHIDLLYQG